MQQELLKPLPGIDCHVLLPAGLGVVVHAESYVLVCEDKVVVAGLELPCQGQPQEGVPALLEGGVWEEQVPGGSEKGEVVGVIVALVLSPFPPQPRCRYMELFTMVA